MALDSLLFQIGLILLVTAVLMYLCKILKQPTILAYIITGMILGPFGLNLLTSQQAFQTFSVIGIAFLLFIVGLNLNVNLLKEVGKVSVITGLSQLFFTTVIGMFLIKYLGFSLIQSVIISLALAFSSTIIVVKLLSDKKDLETLYGKISLGFLIVQDIVAIFVLIIISSLSTKDNLSSLLFSTIIKGLLLFVIAYVANKFFITKFMEKTAENQEILFITSLAWCFILMFISYFLGFSLEIGAFLAGITLAPASYSYQISSRIKPLRDFFILTFFVSTGATVVISAAKDLIFPVIITSLFVLIGNPLIVMTILGIMGFKKRTGFLSGLAIAQTSEFSLIIINLAKSLNLVSMEAVHLTTLVSIVTISFSTYLIMYNDKLYNIFSKYLNIFERKSAHENKFSSNLKRKEYDIVLLGQHRLGYSILTKLKEQKKNFLVVDYNPGIIKQMQKKNIPCLYGDIADVEVLKEVMNHKPKIIISTISNFEDNFIVTKTFKSKKVTTIVTAQTVSKALDLYNYGADYVIIPHILGGEKFAQIIKDMTIKKKYIKQIKKYHIKQISEILSGKI